MDRPRAIRWVGLLLLPLALAIGEADAASVFIEELTWPELRDDILAGKTTVIVPVGGTEQNGPHMVLGKHNARAKALAQKIAVALGNALVAPVVAYVPEGNVQPPTAHMRFPGTITVPDAVFERMLESAARSFRLHGFRDIVFIGDHGDYQKSLTAVAARLNREWSASPARAHAITEYYRSSSTAYAKALRDRGYRDDEIGTHAGLADTSLAWAIDPALVRRDKLASAAAGGSAEGVAGDPRRSSAELGQPGVDAIVAATVDAIRRATARR
jgi:creatinine amidohydrolase/Fe(II)-dependent formamide hydrolase-like protein